MKQHARRTAVAVAVLALVAASCGSGDSEPATTDSGTPAVSEPSSDDGGSDEGAAIDLGYTGEEPVVIRAGELAILLVDQLGDDEAAMGAVLLAGDAGYDGRQIEAAIVTGNLAADGTIADVEPRLAEYGKIAGFRGVAPGDDEDDLLPIERLRREAAEEAGQDDYWPSGAQGTALILSLQLQGYSQEQIVDIIILGADVLDSGYEGPLAEGEEECGGYVIGGVHEIPQFCDPESGELFPDLDDEEEPATTDAPVAEPADSGDAVRLCDDDAFLPPYSGVPVVGAGVMLETEILGPLDTPYYYPEVNGFLDIAADGSFTLNAHTVRFADITIRDAPDNQIYIRDFELTGSIDPDTGDGVMTGTIEGTDQLWSGDSQAPVSAEASGQLAVVCDDAEPSGFAIFGFATGNGLIEFEARP
jgi:hypothetical protein